MHRFGRQRSRKRLSSIGAVAVLATVLVAGCTPPPGPPADPAPPVITYFSASALRTTAPVTATYNWQISDVNNDTMTCRLDTDGNGSFDKTINHCTSQNMVNANFVTAGVRTITLEVSDGVFPAVTSTALVPVAAGPSEPFNITLRIDSPMAPQFQAAFVRAVAKWETVITSGNPDQFADIQPLLFPWTPAFHGTIDDVLIDARDTTLDGAGGLLGQATPLAFRDGSQIPYWGIMEFDTVDLQRLYDRGTLDDVILHEMGHVLGMGSWLVRGQVADLLTDPKYTGLAGNAAYQALGGTGQAPLEDQGGAGTAYVHWRESVFQSELMTGYSDTAPEPLSILTLGALADQGYGVDMSKADPYVLPGSVRAAARAPSEQLHEAS